MSASEQVVVEIAQLPETLQREVLDFIRFLKTRPALTDSENMMFAQEKSLVRMWANEKDEVWNSATFR